VLRQPGPIVTAHNLLSGEAGEVSHGLWNLPTMSASETLQGLYSLEVPSPQIPRLLDTLIKRDEEDQYLSSLRDPELTRLIEFLDQVRALLSAFHPVMRQTLQALDAIPTHDDIFQKCLSKLQAICGDSMTLPSSYTVSGDIARVGGHPITFGSLADVWEGVYGGRKVCVKVLKISVDDDQTLMKVRIWRRHISSCPLKNACRHHSCSSKRPSCGKG